MLPTNSALLAGVVGLCWLSLAAGEIVDVVQYGNAHAETATSGALTADGSVVVVSHTNVADRSSEMFIVKLDTGRSEVWRHEYGTSGRDWTGGTTGPVGRLWHLNPLCARSIATNTAANTAASHGIGP